MTKKTTKRALLLSALSLLLCVSMLVGSTYAWFTDSVTSAGNIIKSGTLDVEMHWADGTKAVPASDSADWQDASAGAIFNYDKWEPGYTEVRHIKIANVGTLALKYQLNIAANGTVSELAKVIDVYYTDPAVQVADRTDLTDANKLGTLDFVLGNISTSASGNLEAGDEVIVTLALKMQESAGNEYQNKEIGSDFIVQLLATQLTSEFDSFDDQYDKNSEFAVVVGTADALADALKAGGMIKLSGDIAITEAVTIPAGAASVLDLNGNEITGAKAKDDGALIVNNGTLTIVGDDDSILTNTELNGGALITNNGTLTLKGGKYVGAPIDTTGYPEYAVYSNGKLTIEEGTSIISDRGALRLKGETVINGGDFELTSAANSRTLTCHTVYANGATLTINGGNFENNYSGVSGASVICPAGSEIAIYGGNFSDPVTSTANFNNTANIQNYMGYGKPVNVYGGTFNDDTVKKNVAAGYVAYDNGNGTWTVGGYKVSSGAELADAIANGKAAELTQDVTLGKIDLTGAITNDVAINANGHKITTTDSYGIEVTAGKNVTISNADVEMTKEGDYITYAAGFKIANGDYAGATITLKDCTITMANTDWAYAVTMPASVKNLNLVIDNCILEGAVAAQCWGDNNTITITNSELICNYTTSALYTSYCVALQSDGYNVSENNTLVIDNCEFKYNGVDNFNSSIYSVDDLGTGNTVTVTNCTYGEKVVAY